MTVYKGCLHSKYIIWLPLSFADFFTSPNKLKGGGGGILSFAVTFYINSLIEFLKKKKKLY